MILFPAIDLKDGKCVRLVQGDFNKSTTYNNSPLDQAKLFDCLLYTSPSPRDEQSSRMPSSA